MRSNTSANTTRSQNAISAKAFDCLVRDGIAHRWQVPSNGRTRYYIDIDGLVRAGAMVLDQEDHGKYSKTLHFSVNGKTIGKDRAPSKADKFYLEENGHLVSTWNARGYTELLDMIVSALSHYGKDEASHRY